MDIRKYFNAPGGASNTKKHAKKTSKSDANLDQSENVPEEPKTDPVKSKSSKRAKEDDSYLEAPKKKQPKTDSPAPESKEKEIPEGAENCLLGKTFVFTGDLEYLSREDAQDLVKRYGGSRTTYVVVGDNPGPKKLEKIKQHNIPTLTEDELLDLVRNAPAQQSEPSQSSSAKGKSRASDVMEVSEPIPVTSIGKLEGYDVKEFNASDTRSKKALEARKMNRTLIIMDEVDGMSAGDRGGVAELVQLIKKTQVFIKNTYVNYNIRLKSILKFPLSLLFDISILEKSCTYVIIREKLKFNQPNIVDEIITGANSDIRQVLNRLSSWKLANDSITYDEGKALYDHLNPFDITSRLFGNSIWNNRSGNLNDKLELYYHESDILPLMIQENYLKIKPQSTSNTIARDDVNPKDLEQMALLGALGKAAVSISDGDLCYAMIHGLLGQTSKTNKYKRILKEIQIHMRLRTSGDKNEIRQSYLPALFTALSQPLIDKGADGITEVIELMDQYYLNKEDWDAIMELSIGSDKISKEIDKTVKTAFTRNTAATTSTRRTSSGTKTRGGGRGGGRKAVRKLK
ncbi:7854_t:CDS:10 [Racocetra fulgida]|uniref:7854_t:CDS:1 n=1 Tax=Racocetra fulgida TaxID=60492 RepID=A0A9N8ZWG7_9GLOM|nr:7854_t:CDS:10 [Racocetra fulgida]